MLTDLLQLLGGSGDAAPGLPGTDSASMDGPPFQEVLLLAQERATNGESTAYDRPGSSPPYPSLATLIAEFLSGDALPSNPEGGSNRSTAASVEVTSNGEPAPEPELDSQPAGPQISYAPDGKSGGSLNSDPMIFTQPASESGLTAAEPDLPFPAPQVRRPVIYVPSPPPAQTESGEHSHVIITPEGQPQQEPQQQSQTSTTPPRDGSSVQRPVQDAPSLKDTLKASPQGTAEGPSLQAPAPSTASYSSPPETPLVAPRPSIGDKGEDLRSGNTPVVEPPATGQIPSNGSVHTVDRQPVQETSVNTTQHLPEAETPNPAPNGWVPPPVVSPDLSGTNSEDDTVTPRMAATPDRAPSTPAPQPQARPKPAPSGTPAIAPQAETEMDGLSLTAGATTGGSEATSSEVTTRPNQTDGTGPQQSVQSRQSEQPRSVAPAITSQADPISSRPRPDVPSTAVSAAADNGTGQRDSLPAVEQPVRPSAPIRAEVVEAERASIAPPSSLGTGSASSDRNLDSESRSPQPQANQPVEPAQVATEGFRDSITSTLGTSAGLAATGQTVDTSSAAGTSANGAAQQTEFQAAAERLDQTHQITGQLIRGVRMVTGSDSSRVTLRLNPAELGEVTIRLVTQGGSLSGDIAVQNRGVQEIALQNLAALRDALVSQGVQVNQLSVSVDSQGQTQQDREAFQQLMDQRDRNNADPNNSGGQEDENDGSQRSPTPNPDNQVDFTA